MKKIVLSAGLLVLFGFAVVLSPAQRALAHPLGNFTINHFARIEAYSDAIRVHWVLDLAEVPTFQEMSTLDGDGDGTVSDAERQNYLATVMPALLAELHLQEDGRGLPLQVLSTDLALVDAQAGLQTLRLTADLQSAATGGGGTLSFGDASYPDRIGWREIVLVAAPGVPVSGATVPAESVSDELRAYPDDLLSSPPDVRTAAFVYRPGVGAEAPPFAAGTVAAEPGKKGGLLEDLLSTEELTLPVVVLAIVVAFGLGAIHALSPGHGKTIVAAYFVGTGGTPRQALFLAMTVTVAHTVGVLALGAVTLWASEYIVPEDLYPTLTLGSGLLLVVAGLVMLLRWVKARRSAVPNHVHHHGDHEHDHAGLSQLEHARAHLAGRTAAEGLPWRSLLALGISGGILPSPTALIVLLGAISLHRLGFGLLLIVVFSLGLATVLTGVGLSFVLARRLVDRARPGLRVLPYAPAAGALGIAAGGGVLAARALLSL